MTDSIVINFYFLNCGSSHILKHKQNLIVGKTLKFIQPALYLL
ncbi:hypothetical protein LEP1GSC073_1596 [Leptospira noguchii str. Cascata]|nr:hypothetical protein LEP1GSC073_1596 [Leptospira noguchii str. Cascata]